MLNWIHLNMWMIWMRNMALILLHAFDCLQRNELLWKYYQRPAFSLAPVSSQFLFLLVTVYQIKMSNCTLFIHKEQKHKKLSLNRKRDTMTSVFFCTLHPLNLFGLLHNAQTLKYIYKRNVLICSTSSLIILPQMKENILFTVIVTLDNMMNICRNPVTIS